MGMYERLTDRARRVMQMANQEAQRLRHDYVGTEHILLGLVKEGSGVAANVLKQLDVDLRQLRLDIEEAVAPGPDVVATVEVFPTPRAQRAVECAIEEAETLEHNYVGTEHLLLGLLHEPEGVAAGVLMNLGLTLDGVRRQILTILGEHVDVREGTGPAASAAGDTPKVRFRHLPEEVLRTLDGIDAHIEKLVGEKEKAIATEAFECAARLRDREECVKRQLLQALQKLQDLIRESGGDAGKAHREDP